jgi:hypothetical protein
VPVPHTSDFWHRHLAADLVRGAAAPAANTNLRTIMTAERVAGWITAQGREP